MKKQTIILAILLVAFLGVLGWAFFGPDSSVQNTAEEKQNEKVEIVNDPIDVTLGLYDPWLAYLQKTNTEISQTEILDSALMTTELRASLKQALDDPLTTLDPVVCQTVIPERIGAKMIYTNGSNAQLTVVARGNKVSEQALVTLELVGNEWVISSIDCSQGEVGPDLEFNFVNEGNLLKQSLQPPLNPQQWHLIYTIDGVAGHVVPLIFDSGSVCVGNDGSEQVCVDDMFSEGAKVLIMGDMQEAGALVKRVETK